MKIKGGNYFNYFKKNKLFLFLPKKMKKPIKKSISYRSPFTRNPVDLEEFKNQLDYNCNHGVCGSDNLGNTCFMNSSIACLSNCTELTEYFLTKKFINDINENNRDGTQGKLAEQWYYLLCEYWLTRASRGNPKKIKYIVGSKNRKFLGYNQQDSNEFMTVFLELLGEDLNRATKKVYRELKEKQPDETDLMAATRFWKLHVERNDSIVTDLFHGLLKSTIICPKCNFKNITFDPFNTLTLTIPNARKVIQLRQNRKNIPKPKKIIEKKVKEKQNVNIYYVFPFSLIQTKKFEIEIYKGMTLNEIIKEIQKRSKAKIRISVNVKFASIANKQCDKILEGKKPDALPTFIFAYEKEDRNLIHYNIPLYLTHNNKMSAYPRFLFFNRNSTYNDFLTKIYILVRKYLKSPFYDENKKEEEFEEDKELKKYIDGSSNKLDKVSSLIVDEFSKMKKTKQILRLYMKQHPYIIYIKDKFNQMTPEEPKDEEILYDGDSNNDILSKFGINSLNKSIDKLLESIKKNKIFLFVKIINKSPFVKENINFDNCNVEKCEPIKEEENEEDKMEIEDEEEEENSYYNSDNITLDDCLQYFTEEESLEEGNEWYCGKCKRRVTASKQIELYYLPRIMCICLTRFLKKGRFYDYTKDNTYVEFPIENLNMDNYICGPDKKHSKYDLFAVSQHYGGMGGGHYTAVCKNIDGNWYDYDDRSCSKTSIRNICTSAAYVLFYRRKNW